MPCFDILKTMRHHAMPPVGTRTATLTPIGVEQMGDAADALRSADMLRLENLDTDLRPPAAALAMSRSQIDDDDANSYLPFLGHDRLRRAATALVQRHAGIDVGPYDWRRQCFISAGGLSGVLNVLLALIEPGDDVLMTSPTYVGLINRVKLAGGVPRFVPLRPSPAGHGDAGWRLDMTALPKALTRRTRAMLLMSPGMPTGVVFNAEEWAVLAQACVQANAWLIHDTAMQRLMFAGPPLIDPAGLPGMAERTITVGAASKEYRMIGWRVGWTVAPMAACEAIARVQLANVVCPVGIAQQAAAAALEASLAGDGSDGIAECTAQWQARHDAIVATLTEGPAPYRVIPAAGGWSLLVDMAPLGLTGAQASQRLLAHSVAATAMHNWGDGSTKDNNPQRYLRLVFANEPLARLSALRPRMDAALR
jgi:N-succinyldiaminopimelate aminotransferase